MGEYIYFYYINIFIRSSLHSTYSSAPQKNPIHVGETTWKMTELQIKGSGKGPLEVCGNTSCSKPLYQIAQDLILVSCIFFMDRDCTPSVHLQQSVGTKQKTVWFAIAAWTGELKMHLGKPWLFILLCCAHALSIIQLEANWTRCFYFTFFPL